MDVVDHWDYRVPLSNHHSPAMHQAPPFYSEGDDDTWEFFPCPFCYVDVEVPVLCNHLQEEHCFDIKNAVCPLCAGNLGKDIIEHFILQHSHMLKRRKTLRPSLWSASTTSMGKKLEKCSSISGVASSNKKGNAPDSAADLLLSPFISSFSIFDTKFDADCDTNSSVPSLSIHLRSLERSTANKILEEDYEERVLRAEFVQQVLLSTM